MFGGVYVVSRRKPSIRYVGHREINKLNDRLPIIGDDIINNAEFYAVYHKVAPDIGHLRPWRCTPFCVQKTLIIPTLKLDDSVVIKVRGHRNENFNGLGFNIASLQKVDIPSQENCRRALHERRWALSIIAHGFILLESFRFLRLPLPGRNNWQLSNVKIDWQGKHVHYDFVGPEFTSYTSGADAHVECVCRTDSGAVELLMIYLDRHVYE